jgi:virginiamycin A acetyltransferase
MFKRNALDHYPYYVRDKLLAGKLCVLARGVKFIMNGVNHELIDISTSPFPIFGNG